MIQLPRVGCLLALAVLAGCAARKAESPPPPPIVEIPVEEEPAWRNLAGDGDRDRIDRLQEAWDEAIRQLGHRRLAQIRATEGELVDPAAALPRPAPPPGPYVCRMLKLGAAKRRGAAFTAFKPFYCYVEAEGELLTLVKQTGSERPAGRIYPDKQESRLIFLGTLALGSEKEPLPYGQNPRRDMAGVVERVAPFRYRLVIPFPPLESTLDIMEMVPVPPQTATPQ